MTQKQTVLRYHRVPFHTETGEDILKRVEQHWEDLRTSGALPSRSSLAPEPLDEALSNCFVLERVAPRVARFRVAGSVLTDLLGIEPRGMPFSSFFGPTMREDLGELIAGVCDGPEIVEIPVTVSRGLARTPVRGRVVMMPLVDRTGAVTRIFGAIVLDGKTGWRTVRFESDDSLPMRRKRVTTRFTVKNDERNFAAKITTPLGRTASLPPMLRPIPTRNGKPHLQLVVDNS